MSESAEEVRATALNERVARIIRSELGAQRRSGSWLARETGKTQSWVSNRLVGKIPLDLDDLELFAGALNLSLGEILGISMRRSKTPSPGVSEPGLIPRQRLASLVDAA